MLFEFLHSKIHRATITDSNLNYVGSITIDEEFLEKANIREWEKVEILDINNGERFQTYALKGKRGSKCFCVNGAAAKILNPDQAGGTGIYLGKISSVRYLHCPQP